MKFGWRDWVFRPGLAAAGMGAAVYAMRRFLPLTRLCTVLEIAAGVAVFLLIAFADHALTREDLRSFRRRR